MYGERAESIDHLISESRKLPRKEYKRRRISVRKYLQWQPCANEGLERSEHWYKHHLEGVLENERYNILWDLNIQCDRPIEARRPDIVSVDKKKKDVKIIDVQLRETHGCRTTMGNKEGDTGTSGRASSKRVGGIPERFIRKLLLL